MLGCQCVSSSPGSMTQDLFIIPADLHSFLQTFLKAYLEHELVIDSRISEWWKKKNSYEPLNHLSHKILNTESDTQHSPPTAVFISVFLFNKVNMFIKWRHKTSSWDYKLVWETFNNIRKLLRKRVLFASAKVFCSTFVFTFKVTRWLPTFHLLVM